MSWSLPIVSTTVPAIQGGNLLESGVSGLVSTVGLSVTSLGCRQSGCGALGGSHEVRAVYSDRDKRHSICLSSSRCCYFACQWGPRSCDTTNIAGFTLPLNTRFQAKLSCVPFLLHVQCQLRTSRFPTSAPFPSIHRTVLARDFPL